MFRSTSIWPTSRNVHTTKCLEHFFYYCSLSVCLCVCEKFPVPISDYYYYDDDTIIIIIFLLSHVIYQNKNAYAALRSAAFQQRTIFIIRTNTYIQNVLQIHT